MKKKKQNKDMSEFQSTEPVSVEVSCWLLIGAVPSMRLSTL